MLPNDRAQPAAPAVPGRLARALGSFRRAPLPLKIGLIVLAIILSGPEIGIVLLAAMAYGVYAVIKGRRSLIASLSVAVWGLVAAGAAGASSSWLYLLLILPFVIAAAAHAGPLARWHVPCRTVAWALVWSIPVGVAALRGWPAEPFIGIAAAWLIACIVLVWRLAKGSQEAHLYGAEAARGPSAHGPPGTRARTGRTAPARRTGSARRRRRPRTTRPPATRPASSSCRTSRSPRRWPSWTR